MSSRDLDRLAQDVLSLLEQSGNHLVCAESCTAGLVSATLAGIPGASRHLCGSAVVYRDDLKSEWLGVPTKVLADPNRGDVCAETAVLLATGVLQRTRSATVAVSVTGHLGPGAPAGKDGLAFIGWAQRDPRSGTPVPGRAELIQLKRESPIGPEDMTRRGARQQEAAAQVLIRIRSELRTMCKRSDD